jgi:hypothetical protein
MEFTLKTGIYIYMIIDPFTITELGVCLVGVLGALIGVCKVSACKYISCGWSGCKCEKAEAVEEEIKKD